MSALVERRAALEVPAAEGELARSDSWSVATVGLAECEPHWRRLEADGLATPYQRFDWVAPFAAHALGAGETARIVEVRSREGHLLAILPLSVTRSRGVAIARLIGGKHANFHMPVLCRSFAARLDAAGAEALLRQASQALGGVDAFILQNQPDIWDGVANPFAQLRSQPSPSQAYKLPLQGDCEATLAASMSPHARKKHKNKRARFAELGPSRMFVAESEEERARILDVFFRQKAHRFAQMGVADPFADAGARAFLTAASAPGPSGPALRLAALELNGELIATYVGAVHQGRFSGMATSFEPDPAVTKVSPGEILLVELIRHECRTGASVFDLGVGEARYKSTFCSETEALSDSFVPITAKGRAAALVSQLHGRIKGAVKQSPLAFALAQRLRRKAA